jgi:hypothetical protein
LAKGYQHAFAGCDEIGYIFRYTIGKGLKYRQGDSHFYVGVNWYHLGAFDSKLLIFLDRLSTIT